MGKRQRETEKRKLERKKAREKEKGHEKGIEHENKKDSTRESKSESNRARESKTEENIDILNTLFFLSPWFCLLLAFLAVIDAGCGVLAAVAVVDGEDVWMHGVLSLLIRKFRYQQPLHLHLQVHL